MTEPQSPDVEGGDAPNPESLVGSVLAGRYRLEKLLGWGAMGAVYIGEHLKIGRRDAIKVLKASLARDPEAVARFARGARNASAIRHPNVCTVYDFSDTSDGLQFLAMELVDGESLTSLLRREGPLPLDRAARIAIQAASGLQAAHDIGIVHRDMKPDNIMLTRDRDGQDVAKVVDFDIAKGSAEGEERGVTRMGFVVGTPEYMSPEQLTGDPLDGRSDVYSLGIVLFRMLTGDLPYRAKSTQELMVDRLTRDPPPLAEVAPGIEFSPAVQRVMDRALARDREARPENALAFARELWEAVYGPAAAPAAGGAGATGEGAPGAPEPQAVEQVPATVVAPRGEPSAGPTPAAARPAQGRGRLLAWGAGAVALVTIGVVAANKLLAPSGPAAAGPAEVRVPASLALGMGEERRVDASVHASDGSVLADVPVRWASERPEVATVDGTGVVHGVAAGTTSLRASAGEVAATTEVTVTATPAAEPPAPVLAPRSLVFSVEEGGGSPGARTVDVTGSPADGRRLVTAVTYAAGTPAGWLTAELEGSGPPTRLRVQPGRPPSVPGSYAASVRVGWEGGPADTLRVTLTVASVTPPDPPPTRRSVAESDSIAWRQFAVLDNYPSPGQLRAVRDTTATLWGDDALPAEIRARAAYAHAQASQLLGDAEEALRWAQRAVDAAPAEEGYRTYLRQLRGGGRP